MYYERHGRPDADAPPAGRLTVERVAAELGRLLDALGEPPVHLVGISLGACVGVALALERPERVRSLLLINGFARFRPPSPASAIRALARAVLLATGPMAAGAALVAGSMFPRPEQAGLRRAAKRSLARTSRRTYLAAMAALATFDARARLARVRCPTLVVAALEFLATH